MTTRRLTVVSAIAGALLAAPAAGAHDGHHVPAPVPATVPPEVLATLPPAPASVAAGPIARAAKVSARRSSVARRAFTTTVKGEATAVLICDLRPFLCRTAREIAPGRWTAELPTGPVPEAFQPFSFRPSTESARPIEAGRGARYRIAVIALRGGDFTRREFSGRYR
jgi:hypothetical protein